MISLAQSLSTLAYALGKKCGWPRCSTRATADFLPGAALERRRARPALQEDKKGWWREQYNANNKYAEAVAVAVEMRR